jgi:hypothetical protein
MDCKASGGPGREAPPCRRTRFTLPARVRIVSTSLPRIDKKVAKIVAELAPIEDTRTPDEKVQDEYDAYLAVLDLLYD